MKDLITEGWKELKTLISTELSKRLSKRWRKRLGIPNPPYRLPSSRPQELEALPSVSPIIRNKEHINTLPPKRETAAAVVPAPGGTIEKLPENTVLITGGAGFIGSALVHALNQMTVDNIIVTDFLGSDTKWKNLIPLKFIDVIPADKFVDRIKARPNHYGKFSAVFHLGACSATTEPNAEYLLENNYGHTKTLCKWALSQGSRFVYASSAATYGDGSNGMRDLDVDLHSLRPLNMYGYSKHLFDIWAQREGILDKIVGLKYFNVFGPNEYHKGEMRSLVCKAYEQIVTTGKIRLFKSYKKEYKDGEQMRDFVYVKDAVAMTIHLADTEKAGGLFNIGTGKPRTWIDLANAIFASLKKKPNIEFIEMPENIRNQYQYYTSADVAKLRQFEYTAPCMELEDSIKDYVKNYLVDGKYLGD